MAKRKLYTAAELKELLELLTKHAPKLKERIVKLAASDITFDTAIQIRNMANCLAATALALESLPFSIRLAENRNKVQLLPFNLDECGLEAGKDGSK